MKSNHKEFSAFDHTCILYVGKLEQRRPPNARDYTIFPKHFDNWYI
jgi:hypothetical protein